MIDRVTSAFTDFKVSSTSLPCFPKAPLNHRIGARQYLEFFSTSAHLWCGEKLVNHFLRCRNGVYRFEIFAGQHRGEIHVARNRAHRSAQVPGISMRVGQRAKKRANALARRLESLMKMPPRREWFLGCGCEEATLRGGALRSAV